MRGKIYNRFALAVALATAGTNGLAADAEARSDFNLPPQPLADSLRAVANQGDINVLFDPPLVADRQAPALKGGYTPQQAFAALLRGTGIEQDFMNERTVVLAAETSATAAEGTAFWRRVRLAQATGVSESEGRDATVSPLNGSMLEEIIVTAQKREERLIDVPQSMSVLSGDDLSKLGATQFRDIANTVPGLSFTTSGAGSTAVALRGVTNGNVSPTVGIYVDDVPYGSTSAFAHSYRLAFDVGLFDLDRVEVLRGPQGTLYGASTMGGLIKYVNNRPNTERFDGNVQTSISSTNSGGVNYNVSAVANVPIVAEKMALRASAYESHDGGYIDNVALARKDANRSDIYGGRLDFLLTPTEALTLRITGFLQNISRAGEDTVDYTLAGVPLSGGLDQDRRFPEPFDSKFRLVSATAAYDWEPATLTSISSYQTAQMHQFLDISRVYVPILNGIFGPTYSAVRYSNSDTTDKFTQEVRLASNGTRTLEWLIGGFYTRETSEAAQYFSLLNLAGQPVPNDVFTYFVPSVYKEYAAFGDLTWRLSSKVDLSAGIRHARNDQVFRQFGTGALGRSNPGSASSSEVSTYLANARYHFSDHATGYVRYATGYRPGGPNYVTINPTTGLPNGPATFQADSLKSYEIGVKAETAERRFGFDLSAYEIDWSNIQAQVNVGGFSTILNATSGATARGAELTLTARPTSGFTATAALAYQDAYLDETDVNLGGARGERLPNVPRFTGALNADYVFQEEGLRPTVGATLRSVSDRLAGFGTANNYRLPAYTSVDLRSGIALSSINVQLYVHNVFDERGQLGNMLPVFGTRIAIQQPRTVGITATTRF